MKEKQTMETQAINPKTGFFKKHKKLVLIFAVVIAVIAAIAAIVIPIVLKTKAERIKSALDGKIFIAESQNAYIMVFDGNKLANERWTDENKIDGDINQFEDYKVSAPLFGFYEKEITLKSKGSKGWEKLTTVTLTKSGDVVMGRYKNCNCKQLTRDEYERQRIIHLCEHVFGEPETIKEATCASGGSEKRVCEKCGYSEIVKTDIVPHNYENGVCTMCGKKEPSKDTSNSSSNSNSSSSEEPIVVDWLTPDYWYTYNDLDVLHIQNGVVMDATLRKKGDVFFTYYSVCKSCHIADSLPSMADVDWDAPVNKTYHCSHCGTNTVVRFMLK